MVTKVFYNSSMPRAGSTIIQNILAQNPLIHSTPTSGLFSLMTGCRSYFTEGQEFKAQDRTEMENGFRGFLKGGIYGFYNNITDMPYVIDKCRGWGIEYDFINEYDKSPKIFCMVRDLRSIFSSLEKKYRRNPLHDHHIANFQTLAGTTTDKRMIHWANNVPTGPALDFLYQIINNGNHQHILFIRFEDLVDNPPQELAKIYNFFELPYYAHDFNNISQYTNENDNIYGVFGDHKIKNKLSPVKEDYIEVLGLNSCNFLTENFKWYFDAFNYKI